MKEQALFEYRRAAGQDETAVVARNEISRLLIDMGIDRYAEGNTLSATTVWRKAIDQDPGQIQALYYLARAYYDLTQYEKALAINEQVLGRTSNWIVVANTYANLGDCYQKLGAFGQARISYTLSIRTDSRQNFRALMSLVGSSGG